MSAVVSVAHPADAADLLAMNREFNGEEDAAALEHVLQTLSSGAEIVLIARMRGQAVGFLCAQRLRSFCYRDDSVLVSELYVREEARRAGVGRRLMQALFSLCPDAPIHLVTGGDNTAAQAFYHALGFSSTGDVEFHRVP